MDRRPCADCGAPCPDDLLDLIFWGRAPVRTKKGIQLRMICEVCMAGRSFAMKMGHIARKIAQRVRRVAL